MWYRFAYAPRLLSNPVVGGFWVDEKEINELGQEIEIPKEILEGEFFGKGKWRDLLFTQFKNVKNQETLNEFLLKARFEIKDGKKFYIPRLRGPGNLISLSNPIKGGFWVNEKETNELGQEIEIPKEILEGEFFGKGKWRVLLSTQWKNVENQETLNEFLLKARFEIKDGKKFYISPWDSTKLINPVVGGFWVNEKEINEIGQEVKIPKEIKEGEPLGMKRWGDLLSTQFKNVKNQETLNEFLLKARFEIKDGKKFYISRFDSYKLINPVVGGFWVEETKINELGKEIEIPKEIKQGKFFGMKEWRRLLSTDSLNVNSQEKLNEFLSQARFEIKDGKKFYISHFDRYRLRNPVLGGFYIGNEPIPFGKRFSISQWSKLLSTNDNYINEQEKLDAFLSDERRFEDKNGVKFYVPIRLSVRESLFEKKFNNYNRDSITIQSQKSILISYIVNNIIKKTILKLDFAFIKNNKPILAIEINGMQHYGFVNYSKSTTYDKWQHGLNRDILKINFCHNNNIPLLIFNHMLSDKDFKTISNNLYKNPHVYDNFIPPSVIDENVNNTSIEFIKRQIYSHLYPVFNGIISFENDESKKRYIKDTLILISKLMGIYEGGIDKTDYIRAFNRDTDLTSNYSICLSIYNSLYPDFPLDKDEKITYSDLSKQVQIKKPKQIEEIPSEG